MRNKFIIGFILIFNSFLLNAQIYNLETSNDGSIAMWTYMGRLCVMKCSPPYNEMNTMLSANYSGTVVMSGDGKSVFFQRNDTVYKYSISDIITLSDTFFLPYDSLRHNVMISGTDYTGGKLLLSKYYADIARGDWIIKYFVLNFNDRKISVPMESQKKITAASMDDAGNIYYSEEFFTEGSKTYNKTFKASASPEGTWKSERIPVPIYMNPAISKNSELMFMSYLRKNSSGNSKSICYIMRNENGKWSEKIPVMPNLPNVKDSLMLADALEIENVESAVISPDGTKIVYQVQETSGKHINYFMVSKYSNGKWSNPEKIFEMPALQHVSYLQVSDSNLFFKTAQYKDEYASYGDIERMYLYTSLDKHGQLIEESPDPTRIKTYINSSSADFSPDDYKVKPKFMSLWPFGKKEKNIVFSFSINKYIKHFSGLSIGAVSRFKRIDGVNVGLCNMSSLFNGLNIGVIYSVIGQLNGVSIGLVNVGDINGVQIGLVNITEFGSGLQIGLFNYCLDGPLPVQIGAINFVECSEYIPCLIFPGINPVGMFGNFK